VSPRIQRFVLDLLCCARADSWLGARGVGGIFAGHRVLPDPPAGAFAPNRALAISAEFLEAVLRHLSDRGIAVVALGEAVRGLAEGTKQRPMACFTFDDGYADNYLAAFPVFARLGLPFTVFVTTGFLDGTATPWWHALETAIASTERLTIEQEGRRRSWPTRSTTEKLAAYRALAPSLKAADPCRRSAILGDIADRHGGPPQSPMLTWPMVREMARSDLVEFGCHTVAHPMLSRLPREEASRELIEARGRLEEELGRPATLLAYPYGDAASAGRRELDLARAAGFSAAVTTRRATLTRPAAHDPLDLPRLPLNGNFQRISYIDLFLSGTPFLPGELARRARARWRGSGASL
jgi:peptidoglycan/xylan/chitin deacetylase (PgdA/CDA1 family)